MAKKDKTHRMAREKKKKEWNEIHEHNDSRGSTAVHGYRLLRISLTFL